MENPETHQYTLEKTEMRRINLNPWISILVITASVVDTHYDGASVGSWFYFVNSIFTQLKKIKKYNMPSTMFIFLAERKIGLDVKQHSAYNSQMFSNCFYENI